VRVKILEIDSERRRLSLSVKRVEEQLPHIRSAAEAGAAAAAEAGGSEEIGDVPDLGLSEDVFAGPSIGGLDQLRNALPEHEPEAQAPQAEVPEAPQAEVPEAPQAEVPEAEPAPDAVDAEPPPEEPAADQPDQAPPEAPDQDEERPAEE
jgi:small subunit ribosomal protein S1